MNKKTVKDVEVKGKKVLVRCDFNVPLDENRNITDDTRIVGALPTIKYLIENGAKVILCSHMGKPKGEPKPELSLAPVAKALSERPKNVEATRPPKNPLIAVETLEIAVLAPKAMYSFFVSFSLTSVARVFFIFFIVPPLGYILY